MLEKTSLIKILQGIGFSENEAKIYIIILELNESVPSAISRRSGVGRANTYAILENLQKNGLVSSVKKNRHLYFRAVDPKLFLEQEQSKYVELHNSIEKLTEALPKLTALHKQYATTPNMSVYQGEAGLIQIMEDTLTTSTELLCWVNVTLATNTILEQYYPTYIKKKIKKQIPLRGIFSHDRTALGFKKRGAKEIREIYTIPKEKFPFENEVNIYDDKVAIISHEDNIGIIIQNNHIANTQRSIFNFAFEYAKSIEKDMLTKDDLAYLNDNTINDGILSHGKNCTCPSPNSPCLLIL